MERFIALRSWLLDNCLVGVIKYKLITEVIKKPRIALSAYGVFCFSMSQPQPQPQPQPQIFFYNPKASLTLSTKSSFSQPKKSTFLV